MLELGQPMHVFDLNQLIGGIEVRRAQPGDRLKLLNGVIIEPDIDTLLVADRSGPLALAGIMGGEISSCTSATRDVFLESALFLPTSIAGRARRYGLQTDSSYRFERGVDTGSLQRRAIERATQLLSTIIGGNPGPIVEELSQDYLPIQQTIILRPERIEKLLGMQVSASEVEDILHRLNMKVAFEYNHWCVIPPSSRSDIKLEVDIIEEIVRVHGYEHIPSNRPLALLSMTNQPEGFISLEQFKSTLVQRGFQEAITYSFVDPIFQGYLDPESKPLALANPISVDLAVMRTSLWPGLLKSVIYNQNRQQTRLRLFECGSNFIVVDGSLQQDVYLGGVATGYLLPEQWGVRNTPMDFYDLKADIEALLSLTGELQSFEFYAAQHPALHPGQSARIRRQVFGDVRQSVPIGWIGALHPYVARKLGIKGDIFVFELLLTGIQRMEIPVFRDYPKFPFSRRDIAFSVDETVTAQSVHECVCQHGGKLLREVRFFDIYRGKGVTKGRKSLALGLILQDFSCSLTDHMVEETVSGIISGLIEDLDAKLRI
jgi:phenylalanyl-tRNA synthetase beta chain